MKASHLITVSKAWFRNSDVVGSDYNHSYFQRKAAGYQDDDLDRFSSDQSIWDPDRPQPKISWNDLLLKYISQLNPQDQEILRLHYQENYTQVEIAEKLRMSQPTVRYRLIRSAALLKILLKPPLRLRNLQNIVLNNHEKDLLVEFSKCMGSYTRVAQRLGHSYTHVRNCIVRVMKKIPQNHSARQKLVFEKSYIKSWRRKFPNDPPIRN